MFFVIASRLFICLHNVRTRLIFSSMSSGKKPVVIITIGMAGSGKTTFVQRINSYLHSLDPPSPPYALNLDPAVASVPFDPNIDIRDTVDYKKVMKQYAQ